MDVVSLQKATPERLAAAVEAAVIELPAARLLETGAKETLAEQATEAATLFQSLLELGYLAASADGLAAEERATLATLLSHATNDAVDENMLREHFADLDAAVEMLGRRERLGRVAANLDPAAGDEAIGFAALIAMADGKLGEPELAVLNELGEHLRRSPAQVRGVVDQVAALIEGKLR